MTNGFSDGLRQDARPRRRATAALVALGLLSGQAGAEPAVRADAAASALRQGWFARSLELDLALDRLVPFRVFTLDAPPRLVVDLAGVDWAGFDPAAVPREGQTGALRVGRIDAGWSRLVLALAAPQALRSAEMQPGDGHGAGARLRVVLARTDAATFAAASGPPPGVWPAGAVAPEVRGAGAITVAIDPGHGGIDPGAVRDGAAEKTLVLAFAEALGDALVARGFRVVLTRAADDFVPLAERVALARGAGADLLISVHANVVGDPALAGAIAFTRAERASSPAAGERARQENAADALTGLGDVAPGDPVRAVLADIARPETDARSDLLADALVAALDPVATLGAEPRQAADFEVLRAADLPSVLVELGFLSNPADRAALASPDWRARTAAALADGMAGWLGADAALAAKLRR